MFFWTFQCLYTCLDRISHLKTKTSFRLEHSGIWEKQTSGLVPYVRSWMEPQVGTELSASACGSRERTSPHHLKHQLTARHRCLVDLLLSNCHRSQQQAGHMGGSHTNCSHTATPPSSPSPPPPSENRTPQLGGKNSTFRWTFLNEASHPHVPTPSTLMKHRFRNIPFSLLFFCFLFFWNVQQNVL